MKFNLKEIPENQLQLCGLTEKDIQNLPHQTLANLLNGNRTSLMRFNNVNGWNRQTPIPPFDAKLSLERNAGGTASLRLHPVNAVAKNVFALSKDEETKLKNGTTAFIKKNLTTKEGSAPVLIALDKTTNEYIAVKEKSVNIPLFINGQKLNDKQKADFIEGKNVQLKNVSCKFDPTKENYVQTTSGSLNSIEFKHSKYNSSRVLIDVALLASGLGSVVLLEHALDFALNSKRTLDAQKLNDKEVRDAVATAISETAKDHRNVVTPDELSDILSDKLKTDSNITLEDIIDSTSENNTVNLELDETEESIEKLQSLPQEEAEQQHSKGIKF